jgi:nicotinate-nucleotide adenylyltransferase
VHRGHLTLARAARDELGLDEVLFLPAGQPWRKAGRMIASNEHRLAMLRRALEGEAAFQVSRLELERPGSSYTADTLEALRDDRPEDELFFLLGEDALMDLPNWTRPQRILKLARLAVARRADTSAEALEEAERRLPGLGERVIWLKMPSVAVSATEIRERVRGGQPIGDLVPATVEEYIRKQGLYST